MDGSEFTRLAMVSERHYAVRVRDGSRYTRAYMSVTVHHIGPNGAAGSGTVHWDFQGCNEMARFAFARLGESWWKICHSNYTSGRDYPWRLSVAVLDYLGSEESPEAKHIIEELSAREIDNYKTESGRHITVYPDLPGEEKSLDRLGSDQSSG
jgi:hypothetical protein